MTHKPRQVNQEQLALIEEAFDRHVKELRTIIQRLATGTVIEDEEASQLESILVREFLKEETNGVVTERGKALDEVIQKTLMMAKRWHRKN